MAEKPAFSPSEWIEFTAGLENEHAALREALQYAHTYCCALQNNQGFIEEVSKLLAQTEGK